MNDIDCGYGVVLMTPCDPEHWVMLDGCRVPYLTVRPLADGRFYVVIDDRFSATVPTADELGRWVVLLAHGMAVAAGYTRHAGDDRINPHNRRVQVVAEAPSGLALVETERP
jgi:hypothetical protein